jgi:hypothetical protein
MCRKAATFVPAKVAAPTTSGTLAEAHDDSNAPPVAEQSHDLLQAGACHDYWVLVGSWRSRVTALSCGMDRHDPTDDPH